MWRLNDPQGNEAEKIKYEIVPYTRGRGIDVGCGSFKAFPHFIGVDNGHHAREFGWDIKPDVHIDDAVDLKIFSSASLDFVFSSHLLEHIEDTEKALKEWWRVIKPGGYLVLYLPDKSLYPQVGTPGANPDHKHDLSRDDIILLMEKMKGGWNLLRNDLRDNDNGEGQYGNEYSFFQVYQKRGDKTHKVMCCDAKPEKTACVVRYGGFGDMIQAASILPHLKEEGYHVTVMTTPTGQFTLLNDPHIDAFLLQDTDQVPNNELVHYWDYQSKKFDRFINLSESVEGSLLALPGRTSYRWSKSARHMHMNHNYLEMVHAIAEVPEPFNAFFYPTKEERKASQKQAEIISPNNEPIILWSLAGSSVHKTWPHIDAIFARILLHTDARIVLVGDELCQLLEQGWENEPRVFCRSGKWSIRESLAFAHCDADLVIGSETGLLNAVGLLSTPKIVTLSHSSEENLTKHWLNTRALKADVPCFPCHMLHYGSEYCNLEEETHTAVCQYEITPDMMWQAILEHIPITKSLQEAG